MSALVPGPARPTWPDPSDLSFARRVVLTILLVCLISRLPFLTAPRIQTSDEYNAYDASSAAGEAFLHADLSERWALLDRFSQGGRVAWILPHFVLAGLSPGFGGAAWGVPAICGVLETDAPGPVLRGRLIRLAATGGLAYCLAYGPLLRARAVEIECARIARERPELTRHYFLGLMYPSICAEIRDRIDPEIKVVSPPSALYPVALYEEEPFKMRNLAENLEHHDLSHVLSPERLADGFVFYRAAPLRTP